MGNTVKVPKRAHELTTEELSTYNPSSEGLFWTDRFDGKSTIRTAKHGSASAPAITLIEMLQRAVKNHPLQLALVQEDPKLVGNSNNPPKALPMQQCRQWTWTEYQSDVRKCAKAMMKLGFTQHDSCLVFGFNAPEWVIGAMGGVFAGGKICGVYPTDTSEQLKFKCVHSRSSVALVESVKHAQMLVAMEGDLPYLKAIVVWTGDNNNLSLENVGHLKVMHWTDFLGLAENVGNGDLDQRISQIKATHACQLIYTSGTTGEPKGAMLSHDNIVYMARTVLLDGTKNLGIKPNDHERALSYLPLSHIAGFMSDVMSPLAITALRPGSGCLYFARPYDLRAGTLAQRLQQVRPTVFLGVPRVWEKIAEKLKSVGAKTIGVKKTLSTWAKKLALEQQTNMQLGGSGKSPAFMFLANAVLNKVKQALGLDKLKFAFSGAAPMTVDTLKYFAQLGIHINEAYGMSETTGVTTWSTNEVHAWGTVGAPLPGMEVRVFKLGTLEECPRAPVDLDHIPEVCMGEVCFRGRHIMMGYMSNPVLGPKHVEEVRKKNEEAMDSHGWLHSGDMGVKTLQGLVKITGRYKELIITAGGENVAPVPIEDEIKLLMQGMVSNCQLIGDKRKFVSCLITLACQGATGEKPGTSELVREHFEKKFPALRTVQDACSSAEFIQFLEQQITKANRKAPNNASRVSRFVILPLDFSVETGELTATMKLKRTVVEQKYRDAINFMYQSAEDTKQMFAPYKF